MRNALLSVFAAVASMVPSSCVSSQRAQSQGTQPPSAPAVTLAINVRALGAVGDGKADDTGPIQAAIDLSARNGGGILIPRGTYRITKTLVVNRQRGLVLGGENGSPWSHGGHAHQPKTNASALAWGGEAGGVLMRAVASPQLRIHDLNFAGSLALADPRRAGVLLRIETINGPGGGGSMLYTFDNTHFYCAEIGLQLGDSPGEHCNSDMLFTYTTFRELETGFLVRNHQGVDFLFNYVFGLGCGTILHFECGGNLMVNNAQLTDCRLLLRIDHGGSNTGTYLCNNVRIEGAKGGVTDRYQALVAKPTSMATVKFSGFDDVQYNWKNNQTDKRTLPLFEVGAGALLTVENSILQGPTAAVGGDEMRSATLVIRDSIFTALSPLDAVSANAQGFFRLENNLFGGEPTPDAVKLPELQAVKVTAPVHIGAGFQKTRDKE